MNQYKLQNVLNKMGAITIETGYVLRYYRMKLGKTQQEIADAVHISKSYVCMLERNKILLTGDLLEAIRKVLGLEKVPITAEEIIIFKTQLYNWNDDIRDGKHDDAISKEDKLRDIVASTLNTDVDILFNLFYIRLLLAQRKLNEAKNMIEKYSKLLSAFSIEHRFFYYYVSGLYYNQINESKKALSCMIEASELEYVTKSSIDLYYAIANLCTYLTQISLAIFYSNKALEIYRQFSDNFYVLETQILLAVNYTNTGQYYLAERIYFSCLDYINKENIEHLKTIVYKNLGILYLERKMFDKALLYTSEDNINGMLIKVNILVSRNASEDSKETLLLINNGVTLAKKLNNQELVLCFEALKCIMTIDDEDSLFYMETIIIPYFIKQGIGLKVNQYCNLVLQIYKRKKKYQKALYYSEIMNKFYKIMLGDFQLKE